MQNQTHLVFYPLVPPPVFLFFSTSIGSRLKHRIKSPNTDIVRKQKKILSNTKYHINLAFFYVNDSPITPLLCAIYTHNVHVTRDGRKKKLPMVPITLLKTRAYDQ